MSLVTPSIDPRLTGIAPGFRALSILVEAAPILHPDVAPAALAKACQQVLNDDVPWADAHLAAWDDAFKAFGAKPKRTPCSAAALRKRVLKEGSLPSLDPVVDIYNAISIRYAIPVGGENLAAYCGTPRLTLADGNEPFDTLKEGQTVVEYPDAGEVIWRAASALRAGFDVWYSVLAGLFPHTALALARSKEEGQSERLEPLWALFRRYGSLRVIAAAAEMMGKVATPALPFPLQAIHGEPREELSAILAKLELV